MLARLLGYNELTPSVVTVVATSIESISAENGILLSVTSMAGVTLILSLFRKSSNTSKYTISYLTELSLFNTLAVLALPK